MSTMKKYGALFSFMLSVIPMPGFAEDLTDIFKLAAENDPEIRQARANYQANHTVIAQGRSQLLPNVTLSASTSRDTRGTSKPTEFSPKHSYANGFNSRSYGLNIRQNLLNFEAWYSYTAAKQSDRQAATNLAISEQQLIIKVATAYFDVLRSLDNLASFQAEEAAAERILEQNQERYEVGLITIQDVYDSQANYDLARVNRLVEENNLSQRYEALEAITGVRHSELEILREDFPIASADPTNLNDWVNTALENNLSIKAAEFDLAAKQNEAKAARSASLPTLDVSAGYNWNISSNNVLTLAPPGIANIGTSVSLNVSVPLYTGGLNSAQRRRAYYNRDASEEALLKTQRDSTQSVRNSYRSVETDVLTVAARQQAIISAQSALEASETGAQVGTRNIVDVVIAQRQLYQALRDYANARYTYVINTLNLKQAAGTLNPQDIFDLNEWLEE